MKGQRGRTEGGGWFHLRHWTSPDGFARRFQAHDDEVLELLLEALAS